MADIVTVTVGEAPGADGEWSDPLSVFGMYSILTTAPINCTWTVQYSSDNGVTWVDWWDGDDAAGDYWFDIAPSPGFQYRIGVLNGDWVGGDNVLTLIRGVQFRSSPAR